MCMLMIINPYFYIQLFSHSKHFKKRSSESSEPPPVFRIYLDDATPDKEYKNALHTPANSERR